MKERPILFSAPMVRALLAGTKTQTRRVVKFAREPIEHPQMSGVLTARIGQRDVWVNSQASHPNHISKACPYGQPGDRLWVREAFDPIYGQCPPDRIIEVDYRADWEPNGKYWRMKDEMGLRRWKPSIHMPRDLSRILLEIVSVRVERLNDITSADCFAEGIDDEGYAYSQGEHYQIAGSPVSAERFAYRHLWESINGPGSWDANPWVWVVEFKRVDQ